VRGQNVAYASFASGELVTVNAAKTIGLNAVYTPPVDVWWEVTLSIAIMQKVDAAYHYVQPTMDLSVADVDGRNQYWQGIFVGHASVNNYGSLCATCLWKLAAGTAYTLTNHFSTSGGTWNYYQSPAHLWLATRAWAR